MVPFHFPLLVLNEVFYDELEVSRCLFNDASLLVLGLRVCP